MTWPDIAMVTFGGLLVGFAIGFKVGLVIGTQIGRGT